MLKVGFSASFVAGRAWLHDPLPVNVEASVAFGQPVRTTLVPPGLVTTQLDTPFQNFTRRTT